MAKRTSYMDLSPIERDNVIRSGELEIDGYLYKSVLLTNNLFLIEAYKDGEKQDSSIGVEADKLIELVAKQKEEEEKAQAKLKTVQIQTRYTMDESALIKEKAKEKAISVSDFVRSCVLHFI